MNQNLQRLSHFVLQQDALDLPPSALERAAFLLLDTLGIAIAAAPMEAGVIARETAQVLYNTQNQAYSSRMLFDGRRVSLAGAVYAIASQVDNLDGHDGYNPTKGHIGVVAIPTLAALAEVRPDMSGLEALATLVIGYEVSGRAAISLHNTACDYHTSGAWNALGVSAMVARVLEFSPEQLRQALGIAEFHGPRSQMMREIANPSMLHDGSGWGAIVGMSAAIAAQNGFTGAPAITLEANEVTPYWEDLGHFWQVEHQYIKPYPICRWAHAAIDATLLLREQHQLSPEQIELIQINSFEEAVRLYSAMPTTTSQAQYSLGFAVAVAMQHGFIGAEHVRGKGLEDPAVERILGAIQTNSTEEHSRHFPEQRRADVQITLKDGRVLDSGLVHARGGPDQAFSESQVVEKFHRFAEPCIGQERANAIVDTCLGLRHKDSQFSSLAQLLYEGCH